MATPGGDTRESNRRQGASSRARAPRPQPSTGKERRTSLPSLSELELRGARAELGAALRDCLTAADPQARAQEYIDHWSSSCSRAAARL